MVLSSTVLTWVVRIFSREQTRKPPVPAGGVEYFLSQLGADHIHQELGDSAGGVILPGVAGVLEVFEYLLIDVAELMTLGGNIEVDGVGLKEFVLLLPVIEDYEEQHPDKRRDTQASPSTPVSWRMMS